MIQYEVKPLHLLCDQKNAEFQDLVVKVVFKLTATDLDTKSTASCVYIIDTPFFTNNVFIPFNELTEEQVISWIENFPQLDEFKEFLNQKINLLNNPPTTEVGLPWIKPVTPEAVEETSNPLAAETIQRQFSEEFARAMIYQVLEEIEQSKV